MVQLGEEGEEGIEDQEKKDFLEIMELSSQNFSPLGGCKPIHELPWVPIIFYAF
jgi:hypothetical protein